MWEDDDDLDYEWRVSKYWFRRLFGALRWTRWVRNRALDILLALEAVWLASRFGADVGLLDSPGTLLSALFFTLAAEAATKILKGRLRANAVTQFVLAAGRHRKHLRRMLKAIEREERYWQRAVFFTKCWQFTFAIPLVLGIMVALIIPGPAAIIPLVTGLTFGLLLAWGSVTESTLARWKYAELVRRTERRLMAV